MRKVRRNANFYLAVLVATIFAIALIFAISSGSNVKTLQSGTPEATIQSYLKALNDGRNEDGSSYFSTSSKCSVEDIDRAYVDRNALIIFDKTTFTSDDSAIVYISIQRNDAPLMADPYTESQNYRLIKEAGAWKISGIPWPLYECGVYRK